MLRLFASIQKEFLVLIRDKAGLAVLFLMPMLLIIIITLVQDSAYKAVKETRIPLVLIDKDKGGLGKILLRGLEEAKIFEVDTSFSNSIKTEKELQKKIISSGYSVGIFIPEGASKTIKENSQKIVRQSLSEFRPLNGKSKPAKLDTANFILVFDPTIKSSFKNVILSSLQRYSAEVEFINIFNEIKKSFASKDTIDITKPIENMKTVRFKEVFAVYDDYNVMPTSVQHNVPAWTLFAMFFIVLPLSGSLIKERQAGSVTRLMVMPGSIYTVYSGRMIVFFAVALIQFLLMVLCGLFILPLFGLPVLEMGKNIFEIIITAGFSGFAAIGYGILIGTVATTQEQAATFGSVSVIILAAIGGVWIPVYAMPVFMRPISSFSPLNWGLNAFYELFLKGGNLKTIFGDLIRLFLFGFISIAISLLYFHKKKG